MDDGVVSVPGFSKVRSIHESKDGMGAGESGLVVNGCTSGLVRDDLAMMARSSPRTHPSEVVK